MSDLDGQERAENAPEEIELRVCELCGRTDRWKALPGGSYHLCRGLRCDGRVVNVTYRRLFDV